jgi:hypothetical protein
MLNVFQESSSSESSSEESSSEESSSEDEEDKVMSCTNLIY